MYHTVWFLKYNYHGFILFKALSKNEVIAAKIHDFFQLFFFNSNKIKLLDWYSVISQQMRAVSVFQFTVSFFQFAVSFFQNAVSFFQFAVRLFQIASLFCELTLMRNMGTYHALKWVLGQVWDESLSKISWRIWKKTGYFQKNAVKNFQFAVSFFQFAVSFFQFAVSIFQIAVSFFQFAVRFFQKYYLLWDDRQPIQILWVIEIMRLLRLNAAPIIIGIAHRGNPSHSVVGSSPQLSSTPNSSSSYCSSKT